MKSIALVALLAACPKGSDHKAPVEPPPKPDRLLPIDDAATVALPPSPPVPSVPAGLPALPFQDRPPTPDEVALGAMLFVEPRLSATGTTSCASCHDPAHGFTSAAKPRPAPLVNLAWARFDNYVNLDEKIAAHIGEQQFPHAAHAPLPPEDPELAAVAAIARDPAYQPRFAGKVPVAAMLRALTAYTITRYEGDAPWDRVERARDQPAELKAGYQLFLGKAQCAVCHTPPLYTDFAMHNGIPTTSVRGAAARPSYFHDASATTLDAAIDDHPAIKKLALPNAERAQLGAFVRALTAERR